MEWWTHLWLNEGFATFMEYLCVDDQLPEFEVRCCSACERVTVGAD